MCLAANKEGGLLGPEELRQPSSHPGSPTADAVGKTALPALSKITGAAEAERLARSGPLHLSGSSANKEQAGEKGVTCCLNP